MGQRIMRDQIGQMKTFGSFRTQEFAARRHIEEKIAYCDGRAARVSSVFHVAHLSAFNYDARGGGRCFCLGCELDARYGSDRGQGLAPKAERSNGGEIFRLADLGSGMPFKR